MSNHISHAALPYPIRGCRFSLLVPYLDADGDPTDPTTPDTEVSKDAGAFADCSEEVTTISGSNGMGFITLTGDETNCSMLAVAAKVASGPKGTLLACSPRVLPVLLAGTAPAGTSGSITLPGSASAIDDYYTGCIVRTTGGTGGGGGSGSLNNQARVITNYDGSTKVATIVPDWETTPDNTTTLEVLATETGMLIATGSVTLAATQPGYAPAKAGDAMTLTAGERSSIAAAAFAFVTEGTETFLQAIRLMRSALLGKTSGFPVGPGKFRDATDSKDRISVTMDGNGNRTGLTTDGT